MKEYESFTLKNAVKCAQNDKLATTRNIPLSQINMSDIYSHLITETGRFAERYASDLLYNINAIEQFLCSDRFSHIDPSNPQKKEYQAIFPVAIRKSGVDGLNFMLSRLKNTRQNAYNYVHVEHAYRKILAVEFIIAYDGRTDANLYDITNHIRKIDERDELTKS